MGQRVRKAAWEQVPVKVVMGVAEKFVVDALAAGNTLYCLGDPIDVRKERYPLYGRELVEVIYFLLAKEQAIPLEELGVSEDDIPAINFRHQVLVRPCLAQGNPSAYLAMLLHAIFWMCLCHVQ